MKSLVTFELAKYSHRSSYCGRKIPNGVSVASGLKSWSAALVPIRLLPPREKGPILTVALASIDTRRVSSARSAWALTCFTCSKMASVSLTFFAGGTWPPC